MDLLLKRIDLELKLDVIGFFELPIIRLVGLQNRMAQQRGAILTRKAARNSSSSAALRFSNSA